MKKLKLFTTFISVIGMILALGITGCKYRITGGGAGDGFDSGSGGSGSIVGTWNYFPTSIGGSGYVSDRDDFNSYKYYNKLTYELKTDNTIELTNICYRYEYYKDGVLVPTPVNYTPENLGSVQVRLKGTYTDDDGKLVINWTKRFDNFSPDGTNINATENYNYVVSGTTAAVTREGSSDTMAWTKN